MTAESRPKATLRRMGMALAVAYVLVLQALLGGLASGAHAAGGVPVNAFGQVLCLAAQDAPTGPTDPAHHTPDCCTIGCQSSAATALPSPAAAGLVYRAVPVLRHAPLPRPDLAASGVAYSPHRARAPPLA